MCIERSPRPAWTRVQPLVRVSSVVEESNIRRSSCGGQCHVVRGDRVAGAAATGRSSDRARPTPAQSPCLASTAHHRTASEAWPPATRSCTRPLHRNTVAGRTPSTYTPWAKRNPTGWTLKQTVLWRKGPNSERGAARTHCGTARGRRANPCCARNS